MSDLSYLTELGRAPKAELATILLRMIAQPRLPPPSNQLDESIRFAEWRSEFHERLKYTMSPALDVLASAGLEAQVGALEKAYMAAKPPMKGNNEKADYYAALRAANHALGKYLNATVRLTEAEARLNSGFRKSDYNDLKTRSFGAMDQGDHQTATDLLVEATALQIGAGARTQATMAAGDVITYAALAANALLSVKDTCEAMYELGRAELILDLVRNGVGEALASAVSRRLTNRRVAQRGRGGAGTDVLAARSEWRSGDAAFCHHHGSDTGCGTFPSTRGGKLTSSGVKRALIRARQRAAKTRPIATAADLGN